MLNFILKGNTALALLSPGDAVNDFNLGSTPDRWLRLSEFRG